MKKKTTLKIKELNNKTRKGIFVYAKQEGKRGKYYKLEKGKTARQYRQEYEGKTTAKKGRRKRTIIDEEIKTGLTEATINNGLTITRLGIHKATMKTLKPLVKDQGILKILAMNENITKIKHRFEHRIEILSGRKITATGKIFNKTTEEVANETRKAYLEKDYTDQLDTNDIVGILKTKYGYDMKRETNKRNKVTAIRIRIIFRKG